MLLQIIIYVLRKSRSIKTHYLSYKYLALLFLEVSSLLFFILNTKLNMHSSKVEVAGQKCFSWCRSLVKDSGTILNSQQFQAVTWHFYICIIIRYSVMPVILFTEHFPLHTTSQRKNTLILMHQAQIPISWKTVTHLQRQHCFFWTKVC